MDTRRGSAAFIMPVKITGSEEELRFLDEAVGSIRRQTDEDWVLIVVDDCSNDAKVTAALEKIRDELREKVDVIRLE